MAAISGQAASAHGTPPLSGTADDDPFVALVMQAQNDLAQSVTKAGLGRDPYRFLMGALSHALGVFPALVRRLDGAIDHARQPLDPVAVEQAVERLERSAVRGADQRAAELARAHNLRTLLIYGGAFAVGILAAAGGGFLGGWTAAKASVHQTEQQLTLAFRDGPGAAATWATLMRSNSVALAVASCTGAAVKVVEGRRACSIPMWLDPPNPAVPGVKQ